MDANDFGYEIPSEIAIIRNSVPDMLYTHDFGQGRYFQVVHQDEESVKVRFATRTMLKIIYLKEKDDIEGFEIIKLINNKETERVKLNKFNLDQLKLFLQLISEIDLKDIKERRLKLFSGEQELDIDSTGIIINLLSKEGGDELIEELINAGYVTSKDIVNTGFRMKSLYEFKRLKDESDYWKEYARENDLSDHSEEKVWQYFLEKNEWIFGYGLDYRFQEILQREVVLSEPELDGSNTVVADYLLGDKMFTTFVELKKPSTPLFAKSKNRSNSWRLSSELIESVSQILEQKASGLNFLDKCQYVQGEPLTHKAYDSKVILIIGSWKELEQSETTLEKEIKKRTFELFRRDSRNIEILTFDELYERASFILKDKNEEENDYF